MNKDLDKALKEKFLCQTKFTQDIEDLVKNNDDLNYIDAIVHYCDDNKIELESVGKLISKPLKEKIKAEAIELNFLKRTSRARLPLWKCHLLIATKLILRWRTTSPRKIMTM